jgi:hypothetical protein
MKARLLLDQWADVTKLTDELRGKVVPVAVGKIIDWKFPEGTIFEGPQALFMCKTGQCEPMDDECMEALDIPDARRHAIQLNYKMSSLGINDKGDRELYRAGVIEGYDGDLKYIPGKNWDAYMKAKAELKKTEDDI